MKQQGRYMYKQRFQPGFTPTVCFRTLQTIVEADSITFFYQVYQLKNTRSDLIIHWSHGSTDGIVGLSNGP